MVTFGPFWPFSKVAQAKSGHAVHRFITINCFAFVSSLRLPSKINKETSRWNANAAARWSEFVKFAKFHRRFVITTKDVGQNDVSQIDASQNDVTQNALHK